MRCRFRAAIRESNILQTESSQALVVVGGRLPPIDAPSAKNTIIIRGFPGLKSPFLSTRLVQYLAGSSSHTLRLVQESAKASAGQTILKRLTFIAE
jgi:hypothetical protein